MKFVGNILVVGVAIGAFVLARPIGAELRRYLSSSPSEVQIAEQLLASPAGELYRALQEYFPAEATRLKDGFVASVRSGADEQEAFATMMALSQDIRTRHAPNLLHANDADLRAVLSFQRDYLASLTTNASLCARVAVLGPEALSFEEARDTSVEVLVAGAPILYRAMHSGLNSPVERELPTDEHYELLYEEFFRKGATEQDASALFLMDAEDPRTCGAVIRFLSAAANSSFPGSDLVRAEMVAAMNGVTTEPQAD